MKFEHQQVCLKLSKELKKADYLQEGIWWWNWNCASAKWILFNENMSLKETYPYEGSIIAPTVAELGEALPVGMVSSRIKGDPEYIKGHRPGRHLKVWWSCTCKNVVIP